MLSIPNLFGPRKAGPPLDDLLHALRTETLALRDAGDLDGARYYFQCGKSAVARSVEATERDRALRGLAAIARELQTVPPLRGAAAHHVQPTSPTE